MQKELTAILFFIAVLGSTFNKGIIQLDYRMNRNYIASVLCVNRNNPSACCQGKCYMKKKLGQDEENGKQRPGNSREKYEINWFCQEDRPAASMLVESNPYSAFMNRILAAPFLSGVFHPPAGFNHLS